MSPLNMSSFKISLHLLGFSLKCGWPVRLSLESPDLTTEAKKTLNKETILSETERDITKCDP